MKTSELTGVLLDYWVARAENMLMPKIQDAECLVRGESFGYAIYKPSTDWAHGGPIIEREGISVEVSCYDSESEKNAVEWAANIEPPMRENDEEPPRWIFAEGRTPLSAAMRAYVESKLGDEVEDLPK